jgi:hypothetical protein
MRDLVTSLIVIAATALVIVAIFWLVKRSKTRQEEKIKETASLRGWEYERIKQPLASGYRLRGTSGESAWLLEGIIESTSHEAGPGSPETTSSTRWFSASASLPGGMVVFGPRPAGSTSVIASSMGNMLVQAALRLMVGEGAAQISTLREIQSGSSSLQQRYMVWSHSDEDAQRLLSSSVESALLAWPVKVPLVAKLGPKGLEIRLAQHLVTNPAELDGLVDLGCRLLDAWQSNP